MSDRITIEAREHNGVLQIRGDRKPNHWRKASEEETEAARQAIANGGTLEIPPPPDPATVESVRAALDAAHPSVPPVAAAGAAALLAGDTPPLPSSGIPSTPDGASLFAPLPSPPPSPRPAVPEFLLDGKYVPLTEKGREALRVLCEEIGREAQKRDDPKFEGAWSGARVKLGDVTRDVMRIEFGNPKDFGDGRGTFAILSVNES